MARRKQPAISDELLDQLLAGADPKTAFAKDGLLDELKKAFAERALNAEIDHHLLPCRIRAEKPSRDDRACALFIRLGMDSRRVSL